MCTQFEIKYTQSTKHAHHFSHHDVILHRKTNAMQGVKSGSTLTLAKYNKSLTSLR